LIPYNNFKRQINSTTEKVGYFQNEAKVKKLKFRNNRTEIANR